MRASETKGVIIKGDEMRGQESFNAIVTRTVKRILLLVVVLTCASTVCLRIDAISKTTAQGSTDWKPVEMALGKAGSIQPGDVYKVSFPRSDLKVTAAGVELKPALALGSWVAFKKDGEMTLVMGDLVLTESEVTPVLSKLEAGEVEPTALHNHVLPHRRNLKDNRMAGRDGLEACRNGIRQSRLYSTGRRL